MHSFQSGLQFVIFAPASQLDSRSERRGRTLARALRARTRSARIRLYSQAVVAKGRVLRAQLQQQGTTLSKPF